MGSKKFSSFQNKLANQAIECCYWKILIPNDVVGSIIGKNGSTITNLEKTCGAKITISCFEDVYPGSDDRVCLISGSFESILSANDFIMSRVNVMPYTRCNLCFDYDHKIHVERSKQVKLLIPQCSASKIIGSRGATIKRMKSLSGSFIQISQASPKVRLFERCVVVAGDMESNNRACRMILDKIVDDTKIPYYKNISYSTVDYPIPSAFPTGPALADVGKIHALFQSTKEMGVSCDELSYIGGEPTSPKSLSEFLDAVEMILREKAYSDAVIENAKEALCFLIHHDILNVCSSVITNVRSIGKSVDNEINVATNIHGNASGSFRDTPIARTIFSNAPSRYGSFLRPDFSENVASSSFPNGRNQDAAAAFNYMPLWNSFPNPLVSINSCAHINVPNCHPRSSELQHEYFQFPLISENNISNNMGQKSA